MNANLEMENRALARTVLELDVNNHAGVMSHVVGMFSCCAYNVEGILMHAGRPRKSRRRDKWRYQQDLVAGQRGRPASADDQAARKSRKTCCQSTLTQR